MKVAILSSGIPTAQYPLNGIFAFDQAKALSNKGIDVTMLSLDLRSIRKIRPWGYTHGIKEGVIWHNISIPIGPLYFIHRLIRKPLLRYLFSKAFKDKPKPDILHSHFAGEYAYMLNQLYNIPYVVTEHSSSINVDTLPEKVKKRYREIYINARTVIAVSSALSTKIRQHTGVNSIVIPNIIDTRLFNDVVKKEHEGFRLVTTSNLIPLKRTLNILKVLPTILEEKGYGVHLDIIGDGPSKQDLLSFVINNGIEKYVTFHGLQKRECISKIYESADCFVLPSSSETFGVAYVEAMAAGLPVIATRCGGPEDFVTINNGLLIEVDDLQQLKESIIYMYEHITEFNTKTIKNNVCAKFSPDVVAKRIISIYEKIN